ncbi:Cbp2p LALA0_S21e00254g [Lachancea lanzarotensis]|uniref:LALA0S21e00254g1_1 n=1 Tax=Lachancea lanzarotensis TaxID=1245769 RepID=A0A0C7NFH6_9SACH|nr:uncharacterized protein LALA0_S21e00254g [Lachancea lanzarotensis]CEP65074.1 LALA0S21e00254g1_1 [Lachancea lanzarotensis]
MSKTQLPYWTSQLRLAYRNSSRQRRFTYKQNVVRLERERADELYNVENEPAQHKTMILPARLDSMPVAHLQAVLWEDIVQKQPVELQFELPHAHHLQGQAINNWASIRSFFKNRIASVYSKPEAEGIYLKDDMKWDRILKITTSQGAHIEVLWPPLESSLACRAIGVFDSEMYDKFKHHTVAHPVTGENLRILKIPTASGVNTNFVALAPQLDRSKCEPVAHLLGAAAVIPSRRCSSVEIEKVKKLCVNEDHVEMSKKTRHISFIPAEGFESDLKSTSRIFRALETGSFFISESMKRSMCSADILRATILSNSITEKQLKAEYCKISVLYSIFENFRRIQRRLRNDEVGSKSLPLMPWDVNILKDLHELNESYLDKDVNELVKGKGRFDNFLSRLNTYNVILNAELRSAAKGTSKISVERQYLMTQVLGTLLSKCCVIKDIYPNLFFEIGRFTNHLDAVTSISQDADASETGKRIVETIQAILDFETKILGPDGTSRGHKLVLLVPQTLPPDIARLYQFSTRLELQITTSLDAVRKVRNTECILKKSIDYDTNIYLYEKKRVDLNVNELLESLAKDAGSS